jgi:hypothetical protein
MLYRLIERDAPGMPAFDIVIDDATMTWVSDPPGRQVPEGLIAAFSAPGPYGTDRREFKVFPNGRARPL